MSLRIALGVLVFLSTSGFICQGQDSLDLDERMQKLRRAKTIIFLGDSITYGGRYVTLFESWLTQQKMPKDPTVINVGLSSETVSGLSENGHAGGRFPRPDLAERLDRVLRLTKPDLVFACYGINCGIYQPLDEKRFAAYQAGVNRLKEKVEAAGAELILITPPTYDDARKKNDFSYNAVLDEYAEWLVAQRKQGWTVIDLHSVMTKQLAANKQEDAEFTFQPDAVHPNAAGHEFIAGELIKWFGGDDANVPDNTKLVDAISSRMQLLRNAYLSKAGHKRPGVKKGLPIAWAKAQANSLTDQIRQLSE